MMNSNVLRSVEAARALPPREALLALLKEAGVTPAFIGYYLGVSRQTTSNWVYGHGISNCRLPAVKRIIDALSVGLVEGKLPVAMRVRHATIANLLQDATPFAQVIAEGRTTPQ